MLNAWCSSVEMLMARTSESIFFDTVYCIDHRGGQKYNLRLGYYVVRNPTKAELEQGVSDEQARSIFHHAAISV